MPRIYTKTGDDGTTGLLYGGRVSKASALTEASGAVDEAVAAIGLARAMLAGPDTYLGEVLLRVQRDLFVLGADLATNPEARAKLREGVSLVTASMVAGLEELIDEGVAAHPLPDGFVVPGASPASAALDVARAAVRRAERRAVAVREAGGEVTDDVLHFLNRLSDLLFVLARRVAGPGDVPSRVDA